MKLMYYPQIKHFERMYFDISTLRGIAATSGLYPFAFEIDIETLPPLKQAVAYEMDDAVFEELHRRAMKMDGPSVRTILGRYLYLQEDF